MGVASACGSGALYIASAAEFPYLFFVAAPQYFYQYPYRFLPFAAVVLAPNLIASSGMESVARGTLGPASLFINMLMTMATDPQVINTLTEALAYCVRIGALMVNLTPMIRQYATPEEVEFEPTFAELIKRFDNHIDYFIEDTEN